MFQTTLLNQELSEYSQKQSCLESKISLLTAESENDEKKHRKEIWRIHSNLEAMQVNNLELKRELDNKQNQVCIWSWLLRNVGTETANL